MSNKRLKIVVHVHVAQALARSLVTSSHSLDLPAAAVTRPRAVVQVSVVARAVRASLVRAVLGAAAAGELVRFRAAHALETRVESLAERT